jgi:hypothetical protein
LVHFLFSFHVAISQPLLKEPGASSGGLSDAQSNFVGRPRRKRLKHGQEQRLEKLHKECCMPCILRQREDEDREKDLD